MKFDKELINYLMSSDFNEDLTTDKLRELLIAFRYHYRYQHGKISSLSMEITNLNYKIENLSYKMDLIQKQLQERENTIDYHLNRKLTLLERIKGKIKNEIRTIQTNKK